ncbi:MAG TPA: EAL domain-containing protein [Actinomycetes bacterium]|jgi:diguanylate cyclase (GGDEF)-like protein|nr:EAL domain-containing protein [Actinomycetes bacterium]
MNRRATVPLSVLVRRCRDWGFLATLGCGAGLMAFFAYYVSDFGGDHLRTWVTDFAYIPLSLLATVLAARAARHRGLDRRTRLAWRILAAAFGCQLFANTVWWWLESAINTSPPFPSLADVGYLAFIPVLLGGLFAFPGRPHSRQERFKLALDTITVVAGGFMVLWYLVLGPAVTDSGAGFLTVATSIAYPVGDLVLVFGIAKVLLRGPAASSRRPLQILIGGLALFVVADVYYGYIGLHAGFVGGSWPDLFWLSANFLFAVAAGEQHYRAGHPDRGAQRARSWHVNRLPYVAVGLGYGLLLLIARGQGLYPLGGLLVGAVVLTAVVVLRQITALRENHELIVTDSLTGLANRTQLRVDLERALARSRRNGDQVAVLLLDLDGFKQINDTFGHEVGDDVLVGFADVLRGCIRKIDTSGRLGGDEFAVVLEQVNGPADVTMAAQRILAELDDPIVVDNHTLQVRSSIGIALSEGGADDPEELLRRADMAMYVAKRRGAHGFELYGHIPDDRQLERTILAKELRLALKRGQLVVHYQPIVTLHDGGITGVEALVRWQHPSRGLLPPGEFIQLAEETGLIGDLGAWVLERACRQVHAWQERFPGSRPLQLSVNLSPRQMQDPDLVEDVTAILERTGFDPHTLVLELTEGVLMHDRDDVVARLTRLKQLGIRIAIDDFGTGYSSLGYLTHLPVDILKIDRCFVADFGTSSEGSVVAEAVVRLSQALHLETVAEGVETPDQAEGLRELGCPLSQGYYFSRPLDPAGVEAFLGRTGVAANAGPGSPTNLSAAGERGA